MIGLLVLGAVAIWLWACMWLARKVSNVIVKPKWRTAVRLIALLALLSVPFVDEIIGKHEFETLCKENGIESVDVSKARGKSVKVEYEERELLTDTVMPIYETDVLFKDAYSGEILIKYKIYDAEGGWLMRHTWLNMGSSHPMLFPSGCNDFAARKEIFKKNDIQQLN